MYDVPLTTTLLAYKDAGVLFLLNLFYKCIFFSECILMLLQKQIIISNTWYVDDMMCIPEYTAATNLQTWLEHSKIWMEYSRNITVSVLGSLNEIAIFLSKLLVVNTNYMQLRSHIKVGVKWSRLGRCVLSDERCTTIWSVRFNCKFGAAFVAAMQF